ncbi:thioesterase II family protein [Streptomyces tubercidicus]|uniref:thioesterase II family protein n=1 Tax=Streptomyces tubercidicus TaxID=47759 RepID=UPI00135A819B|nr:alpha/beta fold hydrolase [Streptomyces tubercidicus]WAU10617.1 thioesterase domain-containing protein [Streptomyces tubercidicus]
MIERAPAPSTVVATLYCFPHAGGAAGEYARWVEHIPGLRLVAVQPPGRAHNIGQSALTSMPQLVSEIVAQVRFTPPFALFGHSLGALVAFEVARALQPKPLRLFVSSCPPPPLSVSDQPLHLLDDAELHAEIERRWGPLPAATTSDKDLLAAALACYRADLQVLETYEHVPGPRLHSPITAIAGATEAKGGAWQAGWREHTDGAFESCVRPGGHFHTRQDPEGLGRLLSDTVRSDLIRAERDVIG